MLVIEVLAGRESEVRSTEQWPCGGLVMRGVNLESQPPHAQ